MRTRIFLFACLIISIVDAQSIVKVEYFIDTDPGFGNATSVSIVPRQDIIVNFEQSLDNLTPGFHQLYLRAKDDSGRWSIPVVKPFYKEKTFISDPEITRAFYRLDDGDAIEIDVTTNSEVTADILIDLGNLAYGFHALKLWTYDDNGSVSHIYEKPFYLDKILSEDPQITQVFYQLDDGEVTEANITSNPDISGDFIIDLSTYSPGFHALKMWSYNNSRSVSHIFEKPFYIDKSEIIPKITSIEYSFSRADSITPVITYKEFIPDDNLDLAFDVDLSELDLWESYSLHLYGRDEHGIRGLAYRYDFIVGSGNSAPELSGLPESVEFIADSSYTINIWEHVYDIETPDSLLTYQFETSTDSLYTSFDSLSGLLTLTADLAYTGIDTLWISVFDDSSASDEAIILVEVNPATGLEIEPENMIPTQFSLSQNYPNPFNPVTRIRFGLPENSDVKIELYNMLGKRITVILQSKKPAGYHEITFNGSQLASGIYFYRIQAGQKFEQTKKLILLK